MDRTQIIAASSTVIAVVGGFAVGRGWINPAEVTQITGAVPQVVDAVTQVAAALAVVGPIVAAVWTTLKSKRIASVAAMPDVSKVVMTSDAAAASHPATNVVGPAS